MTYNLERREYVASEDGTFSEVPSLKFRFQGPDGRIRERLLRFRKQRPVHQLLLRALPVRAAGHLEQRSSRLPRHSEQGSNAVIASSVVKYLYT